MYKNISNCLDAILKWEGYKSNDPSDRGGKTIYGISSKYYPNEVNKMWNLSKQDAKKIAEDIYKKDYWDKINCNNIPFPLSIFDTAINCGIKFAISLKSLPPQEAKEKRINRYYNIVKKYPNMKKFLRGWLNRVEDIYNKSFI